MNRLAILALGALMVLPILAAPVMRAEPHWHDSSTPHGTYMGEQLSAADCEALFGGEGWE